MTDSPTARARAASDANPYPDGSLGRKRPEYQEALRDYREREGQINREFAADLAREYLDRAMPTEVANAVFAMAWEDGHSEGYHSVESHYEDLARLAQAAYDAGYKIGTEGHPFVEEG